MDDIPLDPVSAAFASPARKERHPEDEVIDAIDALIDESLQGGPQDDYESNLYPDCDNCDHDWHGIACVHYGCTCQGSTGEVPVKPVIYTDQVDGVVITGGTLRENILAADPRWQVVGHSMEITDDTLVDHEEMHGAPWVIYHTHLSDSADANCEGCRRRQVAHITLVQAQRVLGEMGLMSQDPLPDPWDWFAELEDDSLAVEYRRDSFEEIEEAP